MAPKKKKQKKLGRAEVSRRIAAEFDLDSYTAKVMLPANSEKQKNRASAVVERYPFFASGQKKVCKASAVKPTCYGTFEGKKHSKLTAKRLGLNRPTEAVYRAACKRASGTMADGYLKPIRADKIELAFFSPAQAKKMATLPGPNVRLCVADNEKGYLVPVTTPEQAQRLQAQFRDCTKGKKKNMAVCALQTAKKTIKDRPLGGFGRLSGGFFSR